MAVDLNGLNILGFYREPKRRRASYEHRDQLTFFLEEDNPQFKLKYRFRKETVRSLANAFHEEIGPEAATNHAFTTEQRICIALKFYATGTFQHEVGDGEGASQSSLSRIISRVSSVFASHADDLIKFSVDETILDRVSTGFYGFSGSKCTSDICENCLNM